MFFIIVSHWQRFHDISECDECWYFDLKQLRKASFFGLHTNVSVNEEIYVIHIYIRVPIKE